MPRRTTQLLIALIALGAVLHIVVFAGPFDDAYITFRYARNVAAGLGPVFNAGERVEGATSLGWVVLLAAGSAIGIPIPVFATALSVIAAVGLLIVSAMIARRLVPEGSAYWILAPALVAASGTWAYYAGTGMETTLFASLVDAATLFLLESTRRRVLVAAALVACAAWFRPEGVGYAAALVLALAIRPSTRRDAVTLLAAFGALFVPFFVWRWHYYGFLLPNTFYAKASPSAGVFARGVRSVEEYLTEYLGWIGIAWLVARARRGDASPKTLVTASMCSAACANAVIVGGDAFAFYRFLLPALPLFAALIADALAYGSVALSRPGRKKAFVAAAIALTVWTSLAAWLPRFSLTSRHLPAFAPAVADVQRIDADFFLVGDWLQKHFPPGTRLAINAAGIVPYESGLPTIDMLGLNDVHIAHRSLVLGTGVPGHEKHDAEYVLEQRPDLIVLGLPVLAHRKIRSRDLAEWFGPWLDYLPGDRDILRSDRLVRDYVLVSAPISGAGWFTFFVRRSVAERWHSQREGRPLND